MSSYAHYFSWIYSAPFMMSVFAAIALTFVFYFAITAMISFVEKRVRAWTEGKNRTALYSIFSDVLNRTSKSLILAISLLISLHFTALPDRLYNIISHAWFLILAIQVALWLDQMIQSWIKYVMNKPGENRNPVTLVITSLAVRGLIWSVMLLSILANAGVDITALIASLGVGGIAIALAVQTILSDVFASLSIGIDKPFEIGDFIVFNNVTGTIEHIGLKTTRIRSLGGEQIVCSNAILLQQTIHNFKRMQSRRVVFNFGISLDTPADKLRGIADMVKEIVSRFDKVKFDRAHFSSFGVDRLTFEVVYLIDTADYTNYMDIQQEINISIIEGLKAMNVDLAIPGMIITHKNTSADKLPEL